MSLACQSYIIKFLLINITVVEFNLIRLKKKYNSFSPAECCFLIGLYVGLGRVMGVLFIFVDFFSILGTDVGLAQVGLGLLVGFDFQAGFGFAENVGFFFSSLFEILDFHVGRGLYEGFGFHVGRLLFLFLSIELVVTSTSAMPDFKPHSEIDPLELYGFRMSRTVDIKGDFPSPHDPLKSSISKDQMKAPARFLFRIFLA